jgi:hypothetical protein
MRCRKTECLLIIATKVSRTCGLSLCSYAYKLVKAKILVVSYFQHCFSDYFHWNDDVTVLIQNWVRLFSRYILKQKNEIHLFVLSLSVCKLHTQYVTDFNHIIVF